MEKDDNTQYINIVWTRQIENKKECEYYIDKSGCWNEYTTKTELKHTINALPLSLSSVRTLSALKSNSEL